MALVEVKVPDIGDFKDVPIIEVMVKAGDTILLDQGSVAGRVDRMELSQEGRDAPDDAGAGKEAGTTDKSSEKSADKPGEGRQSGEENRDESVTEVAKRACRADEKNGIRAPRAHRGSRSHACCIRVTEPGT